MNYRAVQRTLFRMQLDPVFAASVLSGAESREPSLGSAERELLARAGAEGVLADHGGRRRAQILGNISSEYVLTLAEAARRRLALDVLHEFPASEAFHGAIRAEEPLPLAFGDWLRQKMAASAAGTAAALAVLEGAMATARRHLRNAVPPAHGQVALSPLAWLVTVPDGTFQHAQAVRSAVDATADAPAPAQKLETRAVEWLTAAAGDPSSDSPRLETVLLVVPAARLGHGLREVAAERLESSVALLLRAAESPLDAAARAALGSAHDWQPADVENFVDQLVADGVLTRG